VIEELFGQIVSALSPDTACRAYLAVHKWVKTMEAAREEDTAPHRFSQVTQAVDTTILTETLHVPPDRRTPRHTGSPR